MEDKLQELLEVMNKSETFFRLENDENGFYLSIIDRQKYPRIWADNLNDSSEIIAESAENLLNRYTTGGRDWSERFFGENIGDLLPKLAKYTINQSSPPQ